ncbi:hypothetical protein Tco_0780045 [Tanacetum coccineum]
MNWILKDSTTTLGSTKMRRKGLQVPLQLLRTWHFFPLRTRSINEVSTASGDFGVCTACGISQVSSTPCAQDVACSFFVQPTTSPQLKNEDFQQIDEDDLEELDLRWQVAMLTIREFIKKKRSGRNSSGKKDLMVTMAGAMHQQMNLHHRSNDEENTPANDSLDEYAIRKKIIKSKTTDLNTKPSETVGIMEVTTQAAQIQDLKSQIKQLKKKAKPVISHHNAWIMSVSIKQRLAKKKPLKKKWMQKKSTDAYMQKGVSTEDQVSTVKPDEGTDKPKVRTDKLEVSTTKPKEVEVSTNKLGEATAEPKDGTSDESTAPTTIFRDDETILVFDKPRATSTRSILTLKPLLKIDPQDKGKKVLEEEAESDAESEGVDEAERKFDQLAKDEEIARKLQKASRGKKRNVTIGRGEPISLNDTIYLLLKGGSLLNKKLLQSEAGHQQAKKPNDDISEACRRKEAC